MATTVQDCCGPTEPTNPKADILRKRRESRGVQMFSVANPIPDEVADSQELSRIFRNFNFVPYAGTSEKSGHSLLTWYQTLAKLSPTHNSCMDKKLKYAVGGKATAIFSFNPEWETGEEEKEPSTQQKKAYRDAVAQFFNFEGGLGAFHYSVGWSYQENGNAFVEFSFSEVLGEGRISLKSHNFEHCLYLNTKPGEAKVVAISPVWTEDYLRKNPPRYVPLFPNFVQQNGALRTIFHLKNGQSTWYGRPESKGSDLYKFREFQDALYLVKQSAANFTGQLIIEVEDDDPDLSPVLDDAGAEAATGENFAERFERNYTQKSDDPQSVLVTARPFGSRPMFVFQVAPNTNENWYKETGIIAEQKITRSHGCTLRFMSFDVSNGFSQEAFISDYIVNMEPVIESLRQKICVFVNEALTFGWQLLGLEKQFGELSLWFVDPIQSTVEDFKEASKKPQEPTTALPGATLKQNPKTDATDPNADDNG